MPNKMNSEVACDAQRSPKGKTRDEKKIVVKEKEVGAVWIDVPVSAGWMRERER